MKVENYKLNIIKMESLEDLSDFLNILNDSILNKQKLIKLECNNDLYIAFLKEEL